MAPGRRVTERMGQLVASVAMGHLRPSPLPAGWVAYGGLGRDPFGVTHTLTLRDTEGLEPPRLGPRSPWETWCHQVSNRGGVVCMFLWALMILPWKHPHTLPSPRPENINNCPPPHPHGDSAVVSAHQN